MIEEKTITLEQNEITNILVCHLQSIGKIKKNVHINNIDIRDVNGKIKCTIKI